MSIQYSGTTRGYQMLWDQTNAIVLLVSAGGRILGANPTALRAYGYDEAELVGQDITLIRAPAHLSEVESQLRQARTGVTFETVHRRKDGSCFPVEVRSNGCFVGEHEQMLISIISDISHRKRQEATVQLLQQIDSAILQREPLVKVLHGMCDQLCDIFGLSLVWVGMREPDGSVSMLTRGGESAAYLTDIQVRWDDSKYAMGPVGRAVRTGVYQLVDVSEDERTEPWRPQMEAHGFRRILCVPLTVNGDTIGVLVFYTRDPRAFEGNVEQLQAFASRVAVSVATAQDQDHIHVLKAALEAAANAVVITDADGKVLWINPAFTRLTGYAMDEVWGNTPRILKSGRHTDAFYRNIWDTVLDGRTWHGEIYNRRKDGTVYVEEQIITPVQNSIGEITHFIGIKQDVTERKRREERLGFLATHDELTGLFNRRALNERLELLVERAQSQSAGSGALLTMDLDRFKLVNDTLGHPAGDQLLIAVAQLLRSTVRGSDFVARHGGDEFAVVLDDATVEDAEALAGRIQQLMGAAEFPIKGGVISSSVSIGVVPIDGLLSAHEVAELADSALNAAKDSGRGKTVVYRSHEKRHSISHAAAWAARIKDALKEDRLLLHFQPIVQLEGRQIAGYEALARLVAEDGSLIYPQDFLPAAETAGLMPSVDRWVISHVLDLAQANPDVLFFVNLSGHSLVDEGLLYYLQHRLESGHASPGQLVVEVTESVAIRDLVALQEWMVRLRSAGCQFALDDFGAGFSSFAYLRSLPADYVKIDGTYVRDLEDNAASRALVEAMVSAAHALGKVVIAEWIESENVAHELRQMGVALGQGFHLGRPSQSLPREGSR